MKKLLLLFALTTGLISVTTSNAQTYCTTGLYSSGCSYGDQIDSLSIGTFNKGSVGACTGTSGFTDYTSDTITLAQGTVVPIFLSHIQYQQGDGVWIDFNDDGDWADAGEHIWSSSSYDYTITGNLTIGLTVDTGYHRMRVRCNYYGTVGSTASCSQFTYGEAEDYTVYITPPPPCPAPINLTFTNLAATSVDFSFSSNGSLFYIEYGPCGFTQGTGMIDTLTTTSTTLTGLAANTGYEVYVMSDCSSSNDGVSTWTKSACIQTTCLPAVTPFSENFDGTASGTTSNPSPPDCWDYEQTSNGGYGYGYTRNYSTWAHSGSQFFYIYNSAGFNSTDTTALISPNVDSMDVNEKHIQFWAKNSYTGTAYTEKIIVGTVAGPGQLNTFSPIDTVDITGAVYQFFDVYINTANGYNGTHKHIALMTNGNYYFCIDDITIADIPSCIPSTGLAMSNVTNATATATWQAGDGLAYNIEYGPTGFTQGTGPIYKGITSTSFNLTNLYGNTCYDVYVRDSCSDGYSPWFGPITFCTACDPKSTPLLEDFESLTAGGSTVDPNTPDCWSYWKNPGSSYYGYTYAYANPNGSYHWRNYQYYTNDTVALISPLINGMTSGTKQVRFKAMSYSTTMGTDVIVGTSPSATDLRSATIIDTIRTATGNTYGNDYLVRLDTGSGYNGVDQFVFFMQGDYFYYMYLDDINIEDIPLCSAPWNLGATNITSGTADITWSSIYGTAFQIEYGPTGFIPGTGNGMTLSNATSGATISNLSPNTYYDVYVADNCDSTVQAGPFTFKTQCVAQLSGNYTVGGASADFAKLDSAIALLAGCGITAPTTLTIQQNDTATLAFGQIVGASATNTVTIKGSSSAATDTIFIGGGSSVGIDLDGTSYVTFKDLTIVGTSVNYLVWLHNNANHITFDNCNLVMPTQTSSLYAVITATGSSTSASTTGNNANDITIMDCNVYGGYYGISFYGSSTSSYGQNITIENCMLRDQYYYGIRMYYMQGSEIVGNDILVNAGSNGYAFYIYYNLDLTLEGNKAISPTYAMYMYQLNYNNATPPRSSIANNFFSASNSYGIYGGYWANVNILHNSFRTGGSYGCYVYGATGDLDFRNNIFQGGTSYALYNGASSTSITNTTCDYNIYHTGGSSIAYWGGSAYTTLAAWQAADTTMNANSLQGNPGFLSSTDLHIVGTLPNDAADNNTSVTEDIDGDARPASGSTTKDIGADEFTPKNYDVTPVVIAEPKNLVCGDSAMNVKVVFVNLGLQNATNVSATVNITGAITATQTGSYTGSLGSLSADTITVGTFNTAAGGTYNIEAIVTMTNDQDASNDTLVTTVQINDILPREPLATNDTVCAGDYSMVYYPANTTGMSFQWLTTAGDTISDMDSLQVGPMGSNDTTFILDPVSSSEYVGAPDNTIGTGANYTAMNHYLLFTVTQATTIISVDVYANGAGLVDVVIQDASGTTLFTHTVATTGSGLNTLVINQPLAPGQYRMGSTTTNNAGGLYRNNSGANYPYTTSDGSVSITGNTFSSSYYYFFYNWLVGAGGCPRPQGMITIYNGGVLNASYTANLNAPTLNDLTVDFDASGSAGATSYTWDFDDGTFGNGMITSHTYTANGQYDVELVITGACGTDTITQTINVAGIGVEESLLSQTLNVFPNPNNGNFRVEFQVEGLKDIELRVLSVLGQEIAVLKPGNISGAYRAEFDLSDQAAGVYMLQIVTDENVVSRQITIRK